MVIHWGASGMEMIKIIQEIFPGKSSHVSEYPKDLLKATTRVKNELII